MLLSYGKLLEKSAVTRHLGLFDFLYQEIESYNLDTASEEEENDSAENKVAEASKPAKRKLVQGKPQIWGGGHLLFLKNMYST